LGETGKGVNAIQKAGKGVMIYEKRKPKPPSQPNSRGNYPLPSLTPGRITPYPAFPQRGRRKKRRKWFIIKEL